MDIENFYNNFYKNILYFFFIFIIGFLLYYFFFIYFEGFPFNKLFIFQESTKKDDKDSNHSKKFTMDSYKESPSSIIKI